MCVFRYMPSLDSVLFKNEKKKHLCGFTEAEAPLIFDKGLSLVIVVTYQSEIKSSFINISMFLGHI